MRLKEFTWIVAMALLVCNGWGNGWAQGSGPTDAQIAAIVVTANQVDIDAGKLAQTRLQSKEVKAFAERMVTDHTGVNRSATVITAPSRE